MGPIEYTVVVDPLPEGVSQDAAADQVQKALKTINQAMSTYISDSEVSRFNRESNTEWFTVSTETAAVVARALEISKETNGAFDITVGPLVNLWKFGKDKSDFEVPAQSKVNEARASIGYTNLEVRTEPPSIRKLNSDIQIDLSAIAKGYAVDQVAKALEKLGCQSFMVEVGGEVRTAGNKANGKPWRIAIELPSSSNLARDYEKFVKLGDASMATSGDYRNFYEVDGKVYSHTIDPTTGTPVTHQLASISIIAEDCMSADAYATAGMVLGPEKGKECFDQLGLSYYMLVRSDTGFDEHISSAFPVFAVEEKSKAESTSSIIPMFIGTVVIFGLAIAGMAIGAIFNNKPITGSCGGLSARNGGDGDTSCSICHKPTSDCPDLKTESTSQSG